MIAHKITLEIPPFSSSDKSIANYGLVMSKMETLQNQWGTWLLLLHVTNMHVFLLIINRKYINGKMFITAIETEKRGLHEKTIIITEQNGNM